LGEVAFDGNDGGMVLPLADVDADEEFVEAVTGEAGGEVGRFGAGDDGAVEELNGGGDKVWVDAGVIGGGGAEDGPAVGVGVADAVEDVGLAVGGGEGPEAAAGDGEHGGDGGFIDDYGADGGEVADVTGDAGEGDETGAVREDERVFAIGVGLS